MRFLPTLLLLALCACGSSRPDPDRDTRFARKGGFDEDRARDRVVDDLSGESFESVGDTSTCTDDCSGHEAGFEWARDQGVTDSSECGGQSVSFEEGCQVYAQAIEDRVDDARSEDESGDADEYVI